MHGKAPTPVSILRAGSSSVSLIHSLSLINIGVMDLDTDRNEDIDMGSSKG